jgi:Rrf2 family transcriptional regulator, iron-sulfur cluster assembly transcription factor
MGHGRKSKKIPQAPPSPNDEEFAAMNLSTKGRYAVMALVDLARHANGKPVALNEIAQRQEISLSYLEQLFARLRRGGLVVSARGPGGGYRLARPADETRIADIMLAVDEPIKATRCQLGSPRGCTGQQGRCVTHDLWEELSRQIQIFLSAVTLADVVNKRVLGMSRHVDQLNESKENVAA